MARVIVGTWAVRYPLGGNLSWTLQWLVGFRRLGHDVILSEKSGYPNACFDPERRVMSDDCTFGLKAVHRLLERHGLGDRWCFVSEGGEYYGMTRDAVESAFRSADVFVDLGTHGAWLPEARAGNAACVLVDGEPGYTQMKRELQRQRGGSPPEYDFYFSNGASLARPEYSGPTGGVTWHALFNPVVVDLFPSDLPPKEARASFTTIMNWQAHAEFSFHGTVWRQKDVEFEKFMALPGLTSHPLEVAVAGRAPLDRLRDAGWSSRSAHEVSKTLETYVDYITRSAGEFSVCKEAYVALSTGWFSDRSAAYLASGRPVVMQDTGFGRHLPCGLGLFAVRSASDAAAAIEAIRTDYSRHAAAARELARTYLDADVLLPRFLNEITQ